MAKEKEVAEKLAETISNVQLSVSMKGRRRKHYGSVLISVMIADKFNRTNFDIDKRNILMDESIKRCIFDENKLSP